MKKQQKRKTGAAPASTRKLPQYAVPLLLAACVVFFYWTPLTSASAGIQWDAADEFYPTQKYFSDMLKIGRLPFWAPHLFSGMPFLADPQLGAWYPLNWPFFLLGVTPRSIVWETALHAFVALAGAYLLARDLLQSRVAGIFAGVFFAFSGFFTGHSSHTTTFQAATLLPWILWTAWHAAHSARWLPALAAVSGCIVLTGHFQTALYAFFALTCFLGLDFAVRRGGVRGYLRALVCAAAGALALSAVMTLPGLEFTAQSTRASSEYSRDTGARLVPGALLTLVSPDRYGAPEGQNYTGPQDITQFFLYQGILLLPLALVGLAAPRNRWYALVLIVPAAWYAFGPPGGFYSVLVQLPGFRSVRAPIQMWFVVALGLSLMAGAGLQVLRNRFRSPWIPLVLLAVLVADVWYWNMEHNNLAYSRASYTETYGAYQDRFQAVAAPVIRDPLHRLWAPFDSPGFGPLDGFLNIAIEVTFGYNPLQLTRYTKYLQGAAANPKLLDALGVTAKLNTTNGTFTPNPAALPRIYAPDTVAVVRNSEEAAARLGALDPAREALAEGIAAPMPRNGGATVRITQYTGDSYHARYQADHPTLLRIAVPYFPGWQAEIDGRTEPVVPVDLALMGVVAPAGSHELVLRYHATWFRTGALISLFSWIGVLVWLYRALIRRRHP